MLLRIYAHPEPSARDLEVGDERFNSDEIQRLYEASDFPAAQRRRPE